MTGSSANSTPKLTPSVSALNSAFASPLAPLSRAASPAHIRVRQGFEQRGNADANVAVSSGNGDDSADLHSLQLPPSEDTAVEDDAFAPAADPGLLSATPDLRTAPAFPSGDKHDDAANATTAQQPPIDNATLSSIIGESIVISGGTGYNDLIGATPGPTTYVMPISDNGGSSSEIIRTLSGPSIGDIRSRLVRLIPLSSSSNDALHALLSYRLPTTGRTRDIKSEWLDLLEGRHRLWRGIEPDRKEVIRGFLVHFQSEILRRAHRNFNLRGLSVGNAFLSAAQKFFRSIQSAIFLFSATTLVAGSGAAVLPCINTNHTATIAAELQDGSTLVGQCEISHPARPAAGSNKDVPARPAPPTSSANWSALASPHRPSYLQLPDSNAEPSAIGTPSSVIFDPLSTAGADLNAALDRSNLRDQSRRLHEDRTQSSRRTVGNSEDGLSPEEDHDGGGGGDDDEDEDDEEFKDESDDRANSDACDDALGSNAKSWKRKGRSRPAAGNIVFSKGNAEEEEPLPSPIRYIYYINSYRNIVWPAPNPSYVSSLHTSRTLIYSCGSLWTSIIPSLALRGVGTSIARSSSLKYKVLLLNTSWDRETDGYTAAHFVDAITRTLNLSDDPHHDDHHEHTTTKVQYSARDYITHIVYYADGQITLHKAQIQGKLGIKCIEIPSQRRADGKPSKFCERDVRWALAQVNE